MDNDLGDWLDEIKRWHRGANHLVGEVRYVTEYYIQTAWMDCFATYQGQGQGLVLIERGRIRWYKHYKHGEGPLVSAGMGYREFFSRFSKARLLEMLSSPLSSSSKYSTR